uniref:right-handed parallel beta-helix repeat-containing protein n=1 Tax=Altererythrobacter segetis TaxID=1104773 RepID=UPI00140960F9|nr:right-handed parallel beta-helix repeat-containing protein [Altererythrobacter segetis]
MALTFTGAAAASCARAPTSNLANALRPEQFGAGQGADDTAALQTFLDRLGNGMQGLLDGNYWISSELRIRNKREFSLRGPGRITVRPGVPAAWGHGGLRLTNCSDFTLSGFSIDGNRRVRAPRELPAHNFIFETCRHFQCTTLTSLNSVVDGFMFYTETPAKPETHCSDFVMRECVARQNWRQGCSVVHGRRGQFLGGVYAQTHGTDPSAGIDLEADQDSPLHSVDDILLQGVRFEGNAGFGLLVSGVARPRAVRVVDCVFVDNDRGAISWGAESGEIIRPTIEGFTASAQRGAIDVPAGPGGNVAIASPVFRRVTAAGAGQPLVYVHAQSAGLVKVDRLDVDDCGAVVAFWAPKCELRRSQIVSSLGNFDGAILVYGPECTISGNAISNFYGAIIYVEAADAAIVSNRLSSPRGNSRSGCIHTTGKRSLIVDNFIEANGGLTAIMAPASATVRGNQIRGFQVALRRL